jgi:phosphonoacetate hydrolase
VISRADVCIGGAQADHDLSGLKGHRPAHARRHIRGKVPFIVNRPLNDAYRMKAAMATLKSYQIFDFALNGAAQ